VLKNPKCKKYIQYSEKFQAHSVFQGKRNLLKNPDVEKYIEYGEKFPGTLCFSGQAQMCSKILNVKSIFNAVKNFREHSVFRAGASGSKLLNVKIIFNAVKNFRAHSVFNG